MPHRTITEIIVHCTATPAGRHVTVDDVRRWHHARGFADVGYHFLVLLDGTIQPGRPIERVGAHCLGHNAHSVGVAYVGGTDSAGRPLDTRTPSQTASLRRLVAELLCRFPCATLHGHREFARKDCPCFDVATLLTPDPSEAPDSSGSSAPQAPPPL